MQCNCTKEPLRYFKQTLLGLSSNAREPGPFAELFPAHELDCSVRAETRPLRRKASEVPERAVGAPDVVKSGRQAAELAGVGHDVGAGCGRKRRDKGGGVEWVEDEWKRSKERIGIG